MKNKTIKNENQALKPDHKTVSDAKNNSGKQDGDLTNFPGYPHYNASEDIYTNEIKVALNPEDLSKTKKLSETLGKRNEKDFSEVMTGDDLDVPGSSADQAKSNAGREDEENNYYSLGGDNHNDLEEDKG